MSNSDSKLSPAELLAELKATVAATPLEHQSDLSPERDELNLDFSDVSDPSAGQDSSPETETTTDAKRSADRAAKTSRATNDPRDMMVPAAVQGNSQLAELFDRVHNLLGHHQADADAPFRPETPETLEQTGLTFEDIERLVLKYLLSKGAATGRQICAQVKLPFPIVDPILRQLKQDQLLAFKGTAAAGDYDFVITEMGRDRAKRYAEECTYFGAAPVPLKDYLKSMAFQSIAKQEATEADLQSAFSDLIINDQMFNRLGPAINSGRGMFLFGEPGNGKTSIAERITRCFGSSIWIPRALTIDGDIMRVFDPGVHEVIEHEADEGIFDLSGVDQRWVNIVRPTVIAGGELTMSELEVVQNAQTKICEAPLQLKSNCGTLVIDDFGRQAMPVEVLLNRWIVPLEKRYDFLNMPSGKKIQVPFDQLIIFSTNLEPKDLVDGAFLRRIPYKIEVPDPSQAEFEALFKLMSPIMGFEFKQEAFDYLIETHYLPENRPFRACQPRDLLLQVKNYCVYKKTPRILTPEGFDFAVDNYFSVM